MVRLSLPLAVCCLLITGCGPAALPPGVDSAEGLSDERPAPPEDQGFLESEGSTPEETGVAGQNCAANPRSQLVVTDQAPLVLEFAANGSSVVYQRWDGRYLYMLADVPTGRRTGPLGEFITYSANERRAIFRSDSGAGPARLLDISPSTGSTSVIFEGQVDQALPIAERRAVLLFTPAAPVWVYFTDTRRLRQLSPTPVNRADVALSSDETLAVFRTGNTLRYLDITSRSIETISSDAVSFSIVSGQRRVTFRDSSDALWGWTPERGSLRLDSHARDITTSVAGDVLWIDGDGRVRFWRPAFGTLETVATGAERAGLAPSGNRFFFFRREGSHPSALVVRDLASGQEQVVRESTQRLRAVFSDDGRLLAFNADPEDDPVVVGLWDFSKAGEVALSPAPPDAHYGAFLSFRQAGAILQIFVWDKEVLLYDTASGALIYRESRSVVGAEGEFSFWSPDESFFFTPVGGYLDRPSDLFAFRPSRRRENFVAPRVLLACFVGERPVFFHDVELDNPVLSGKLAAWDPWGRTRWELSANGELPRCLSHKAAVVFLEDLMGGAGTLVYASLPKQRRTVLGSGVTAYVVHPHRLMYSDSRSICIVRF
jgi:hypothetical protein